MISHSTQAITRVSDLDTQRHITSRTYESMALGARHELLSEQGLPIEKMITEQHYLHPKKSYIRFFAQQQHGATLVLETQAYFKKGGLILWDQKIYQTDQTLVSHIQTLTLLAQKKKKIDLVSPDSELPAIHYSTLPKFRGTSKQIKTPYSMNFSDRDSSGAYPPSAIWRVFEEGRWSFGEKTGMTLERMTALDTISFYMGGVINVSELPRAGEKIMIKTWIHKVEKIRYWFRQDVVRKMPHGTEKILMSMCDEQLIVSLSKARPKKAPPEFIQPLIQYVEMK